MGSVATPHYDPLMAMAPCHIPGGPQLHHVRPLMLRPLHIASATVTSVVTVLLQRGGNGSSHHQMVRKWF